MIQVINRAMDILEYVAIEPDQPKVLGKIAEDIGLNAGTCANIIKTLVTRNYLLKMDRQKGYCLGPMAYTIAGNRDQKKHLADIAKDEIDFLTESLKEDSLLCILKNDIRLVIYRARYPHHDLQANTPDEKRAYDTASGRLLIAMLPEEDLKRFVLRHGLPLPAEWEEVKDEKGLLRQFNKIKNQGYATQITTRQIMGIAVPVYHDRKVIAALSIYMPLFRFKSRNKNELIKSIKLSADRIAEKFSK